MSEQTKRVEALDIAKGIGIILVIIGHMSSSYLRDWIYSFHMPLFFYYFWHMLQDRKISIIPPIFKTKSQNTRNSNLSTIFYNSAFGNTYRNQRI